MIGGESKMNVQCMTLRLLNEVFCLRVNFVCILAILLPKHSSLIAERITVTEDHL